MGRCRLRPGLGGGGGGGHARHRLCGRALRMGECECECEGIAHRAAAHLRVRLLHVGKAVVELLQAVR